MRLTAMRGFSGSGKSTKAAEIAKETGAVIVCRDDLRKMLLGSYWTGKSEDEDRVTVAEEAQVSALLKSGVSVVVDATHLRSSYLRGWSKLATKLGAEFEVVDVRTSLTDCLKRDLYRMERGERSVGGGVINQQAKRFPMDKWPTITADAPFVIDPADAYNPALPDAIIVDIDGTLAHMTGRSPYDYSRVNEDVIDPTIRDITYMWQDDPNKCKDRYVLVCSGRGDDCREVTCRWLVGNDVFYDQLIMRPTGAKDDRGNKLPDWIVKYNLYNEHIRGKYNVSFVLDDRNQVVDMWRKLGLKCLQVAPGDF